jgi:hypothetical protein
MNDAPVIVLAIGLMALLFTNLHTLERMDFWKAKSRHWESQCALRLNERTRAEERCLEAHATIKALEDLTAAQARNVNHMGTLISAHAAKQKGGDS